MDGYYYYGFGLLLWPLFFGFLVWALFALAPDRWNYRGRQNYYGRYGYPGDWEYPYFSEYSRHGGKFRGRGPRGYQRTDGRIAEDINDRLLVSGDIDASDIEVRVENGVVTLSGQVSTRNEKRIAYWLAENVPGVMDVKNEIQVERNQKRETEKKAA